MSHFKDISKDLIAAVRGVMESKEGGHPKTAKQKELAAKAPPHDKITHADVLAARGVLKKHPETGKMVTKEEAEQIDELSPMTKDSYVQKASKQIPGLFKKSGKDADSARKYYNRKNTMRKMSNEEAEQIDELSTKTLRSYRDKARDDAFDADAVDDERRLRKRSMGHNTAGKKIIKRGDTLRAEEVETIDEAMSSYDRYASTHADIMRLHKSIGDYLNNHKKEAMSHKDDYINGGKKGPHWGHVADVDHVHGQLKALHDAMARKEYFRGTKAAESVEVDEITLSDQEIAALDELNANFDEIDEARGRPPKEGSAAWKRRQEAEKKGETEGDEPRQHIIQQLQRAKLSMQGGAKIKFKNGQEHDVSGSHASKLLDKYAGMKPGEKESFQKEIGASHEGLKKHL